MSDKNRDWHYFHCKLMHYNFHNKQGMYTPKWLLFWNGYNADDLLNGKTKFKKRSRKDYYTQQIN